MIDKIWLGIGLVGQMTFAARFIVQWLYSEYRKQSVIPTAFWYFSLIGSMVLLSYAIHRRDPVFILGQCTGFLVYCRNLMLIYKHKQTKDSESKANSYAG